MKYSQDRKASEETLRLIIQRIAAHPAAFTPHTYAVWYEYLMGINSSLSTEMNQLLGNKKLLDDDTILLLHERYVSESDQNVSRLLREDIKHLLGNLLQASTDTDKHTQTFGNNLQAYGEQLNANPDLALLDDLIGKLASDTKSMHGSVTNLHSELENTKDKVGKLQQELESARQEALMDPLTGIYNRRGFEIQVKNLFADSALASKAACLLMVDIDHFKKINDSYGHLFGDKVIHTLANTLKSQIKGQDSVARIGGEEFAVLLPETTLNGARTVAEHIRSTIENGKIRQPNSDTQMSSITVSIGIAIYQSNNTLVEWMDMADKALYVSKESGRNKVTIYDTAKA